MLNEQDMKKVFAALCEDCPVPIYRENTNDFVIDNLHLFNEDCREELEKTCKGSFGTASFITLDEGESERIGKPQRFILIDPSETDAPHLVYFLLHELGHYVCSVNGCECDANDDNDLLEFHADQWAMGEMLRLGWTPALAATIMWIQGSLLNKHSPYHCAAKSLARTKLWEDAIKAVETPIVPHGTTTTVHAELPRSGG